MTFLVIFLLTYQLGSDDFRVREQASRELLKLGTKAIPALKEAAKSKDVEVVHRAKALLGKLDPVATPKVEPSGVVEHRMRLEQTYGPLPVKGIHAVISRQTRNGMVLLQWEAFAGFPMEATVLPDEAELIGFRGRR